MNYANHFGYSDITPFEVVKRVSAKTLEIREMSTTELPWDRQYMAGGFLGHVVNQFDQRLDIQPDPDAPVFRIRQHKSGQWYDRDGRLYTLSSSPRKFRNFNF